MLGDYENNSVEEKRIESDRISGLLDQTLDAATIIDEEGKSSTLLVSLLGHGRLISDVGGRGVTFRRRMVLYWQGSTEQRPRKQCNQRIRTLGFQVKDKKTNAANSLNGINVLKLQY